MFCAAASGLGNFHSKRREKAQSPAEQRPKARDLCLVVFLNSLRERKPQRRECSRRRGPWDILGGGFLYALPLHIMYLKVRWSGPSVLAACRTTLVHKICVCQAGATKV